MGRKINFAEKPKKGPGRKAKKQKDPVFDKKLLKDADSEEPKKLSHRQKIRAKKRELQQVKKQELKAKTKEKKVKAKKPEKPKYTSDDEAESEEENKVQNSVQPKIDLQKSREKYAKITSKTSKQPAVQSESEEDASEDYDSSEEEENGEANKRGRDILASDDESDEEMEPQAKVGKLKDFMDSDEDDENESMDEDAEDDDEEGEDEDDSMLPIERAGKKLKRKLEEEKRLGEEEMEEAAAHREKFQFPDEEEAAPTNLQDIHMRIKEVIGVLADFSVNRDPNRSRTEYMELLCKDLCLYYSYNEFFMQLLMKIFSPNELLEFLEASEVQRPLTIRTNSLKTRRRDLAQALINRGVNLDPIGKWSKEGLVVYSSQVPLGATPEYLAGHYMIQGASSMLPVIALAPEENERILDLCSAPGGKSSHIAALMKNTGVLFANDVNKDRLQAVSGNFHRLGIQNAIVTSIDGTKYREVMTGFDRVLLDAPCTGSGVISKDPSVKTTKTEVDIQRCYNLQRKLLLTAIDCLSANSETGGYLVYSTCSILPQENEWVVDYALRKRNVRLVPTGLDFGNEGLVNFAGQKYHPSMKLTRRFYPHTFNMDGFFVAKLQKFSDAIPNTKQADEEEEEAVEEQETEEPELPKKIDKRDWYYKDIIEKRKKQREDPHHIVKVFEKPTKPGKKDKSTNGSHTPSEEVSKQAANLLKSSTKKAKASEKKLKKKRLSLPEQAASNGVSVTEENTPKQKKIKKRLSLPGSAMRKVKK